MASEHYRHPNSERSTPPEPPIYHHTDIQMTSSAPQTTASSPSTSPSRSASTKRATTLEVEPSLVAQARSSSSIGNYPMSGDHCPLHEDTASASTFTGYSPCMTKSEHAAPTAGAGRTTSGSLRPATVVMDPQRSAQPAQPAQPGPPSPTADTLFKYNLPPPISSLSPSPTNYGPSVPASIFNYRPIHRQVSSRPPSVPTADPSLTLPPIRQTTQYPSATPSTLEPSVAPMPAIYDHHPHHYLQPHYHQSIPPTGLSSPPPPPPPPQSVPPTATQIDCYTSISRAPHSPPFTRDFDIYSVANPSDPECPRQPVTMHQPIIHAKLLQLLASGLLTGAAGTQNPEALLVSPLAVRCVLSDNDATQLCALPFFGSFTHRELTAQAQLLARAIMDASIEETVPYVLKEEHEYMSRSGHRKKKRSPPQPRWWTRMENAAIFARMLIEDARTTPKNSLWGYVKWGLEACWREHEVNGSRDGAEKAGEHIYLGGEVDWLLQVNSEQAWELVRSGSPKCSINARYRTGRTPTSASPRPQSPYPTSSNIYSQHYETASPAYVPQTSPYSYDVGYTQSPPIDYYVHSPEGRRHSYHQQFPDYSYYQSLNQYQHPLPPSTSQPTQEHVVSLPENAKPPPHTPLSPTQQHTNISLHVSEQANQRRPSHPLSNCDTNRDLSSPTATVSRTSPESLPKSVKAEARHQKDAHDDDDGIL